MKQILFPAPQPVAAGRPSLYLIAAVAANGVIGAHGGLPWRLPEDLRHFKRMTQGHAVIMGRRTWESIGRALPGRRNVVVTRRAAFAAPGASVAPSLEAALELCRDQAIVFVIGGAALYQAALPLADGLLLTEIHRDYEGDTRFPEIDRGVWRETDRMALVAADGTRFDFVRYVRA
jgi:dihydrofolate reductase